MDERFTLNDLIFTPGSIEELPQDTSVDSNWNEEAAKEQTKKIRERNAQLLRDFEESFLSLETTSREGAL